MGDLGAGVIKVEKADGGDDARGWGPPFVEGAGISFHSMNRNKHSLVLAEPQTQALGIVQPLPDTGVEVVALPVQFDGVRPPLRGRAPRLGEHTREILGQ